MEPLRHPREKNETQLQLLAQVIDSFNGAASKFEKHYQYLAQRVGELNHKLENSNKALVDSLKEKEEVRNHLRNILESIPTGVLVIDLTGNITTFNRSAQTLTGLPSKDVIGRGFDSVFGHSFFRPLQLEYRFLRGIQECTEYEAEISGKGGDSLHVSLSISPLKTRDGMKVGVVLCLQDITQIKRLEEQASRTGRLTAMGEMAVKIAHEIRNPLGSIELFATTIKKDLEDLGGTRDLVDHISSGVKSINNIISNLLLFIRREKRENFRMMDVHDPLRDSINFSNHLFALNERIKLHSSYYPRPLMVNGDSELIKQVYLNFILNAIQAMPHGGTLRVVTRRLEGDKNRRGSAEIEFIDTGIGISREDMPRIFDPFFTTKTRGTGLGLAIAHNIVELHGGTIDIECPEKRGTLCRVNLPLWERTHGA
jgi:PAS domain S-box-containing protein